MKKIIIFFAFIFSMLLTSCDGDNFIIHVHDQNMLSINKNYIIGGWKCDDDSIKETLYFVSETECFIDSISKETYLKYELKPISDDKEVQLYIDGKLHFTIYKIYKTEMWSYNSTGTVFNYKKLKKNPSRYLIKYPI